MAMKRLAYRPGINTELSASANPQGWTASNCCRFRWGMPETLRGFLAFCQTALTGVARAMHFWTDLSGVQRFAAGTNTNLYLINGITGVLTDITPPGGNQTSYNVYVGTASGGETLQNSSPIAIGTNWTEPTSGLVSGRAPPSGSTPPLAPSLSTTSGGSLAAQIVYVQLTYVGTNSAETLASPQTGPFAVAASNLFVVASPATSPNQTDYNVYAGTSPTALTLQNASPIAIGTNWTEPTGGLISGREPPFGASPPIEPSTTTTSGGSLAAQSLYVVITYVGPEGETLISAEAGPIAVAANNLLVVESPLASTYGFIPGPVSSQTNVQFSLLIWSLDNFGQDLIAVPSGQGLFIWTPPSGVAVQESAAPAAINGAIVLDQIQIILAWGCTPLGGGSQDAMLLRWCDQSDFTDWTASTTNQAGSFRLPHGSRIIGGLQVPGMALIWTDISVWAVQYVGFPLVFEFQPIGELCGLIAQKALCVLGQIVYWMSDHGFFRLTGAGPEQMACPVWDVVYTNLVNAAQDKCLCGTDYHKSEVWFLYPSINGGTNEIDSYVKLNVLEGEWDYGPAQLNAPNPFSRTAWVDTNQPGAPLAIDLGGLAQQIDQGYTLNGTGFVPASVRSGFMDISDGAQLISADQFLPDFIWQGTNPMLNVTLYFRQFPGDTPMAIGPFSITPTTEYVTLRVPQQITVGGEQITIYVPPRGREVAVEIDNAAPGFWRLGNCRLRAAPAGRI